MIRRVTLFALLSLAGCGSGSGTATPAETARGFAGFTALVAEIEAQSPPAQRASVEAFASREAESLSGWPLRDGLDAWFLTSAPGATSVAVAGSWNQFSTSARPLERLGETDFWAARVTLPASDRYEYKFVIDGTFVADALNRKFSYDFDNSVLNLAGSGKSHLERRGPIYGTSLALGRSLVIYLPRGALDEEGRYPVVYMHDGQNLFNPNPGFVTWDAGGTIDQLIDANLIEPIIVVGIENTSERIFEYTHVADDISESCDGSEIVGGGGAFYGDFIAFELKPLIDAAYPTRRERTSTAVLGSSLGGLISFHIGYTHSDVFGLVGGMSSTLFWGGICLDNTRMYDIATAAGKLDARIYLDSGGPGSSDPDQDNWGATEEFKLLLERQGYVHGVDLRHWWEPGAPHSERAWGARLDKPLLFWFGTP